MILGMFVPPLEDSMAALISSEYQEDVYPEMKYKKSFYELFKQLHGQKVDKVNGHFAPPSWLRKVLMKWVLRPRLM